VVRVLIAGAKGMLGRRVVEFGARVCDVSGFDVDECDITREEETHSFVSAARPDVVINCAAMTDVDGCEARFEEALAVNGRGAGNLARAAHMAGAAILHVSTDYVFDGKKAAGYGEDDPVSPCGAYGKSKLLGEELVAAGNPRHWIVRTQWLFGPDGKNFVHTILRLAAEREHLEVVDDQVGCPTYSADLAKEIIRIVERRPPYGIYHCSSKGSCSWFEFAQRIVELSGRTAVAVVPMSSKNLDRPASRPAFSVLRNMHLEKTIGDGMPHWLDALRSYLTRLTGEGDEKAGRRGSD